MSIKHTKNKMNNAGSSLIEVILAMAILAILAIPLLNYFMESMKYNAKMSAEQHATLLAQQTIEDLKSQDVLIESVSNPDDIPGYKSAYLESLGFVKTASDAKGVSYYGEAEAVHKDYDVVVAVNTDTQENSSAIPQINGIDDTCDVIVRENGQAEAALAWFQEVNRIYAEKQGNMGLLLSEDSIKDRMHRIMKCSIEKDGSYYRVTVGCTYTCDELRGADSTDRYQCTDYADQLLKEVKGIYLFFNAGKNSDCMEIVEGSGISLASLKPELYLVCQDSIIPAGYHFKLKGAVPAVCSNLSQTQIVDERGVAISSKQGLVESAEGIHRIELEVKVYEKGKGNDAAEKPYVTLNAAKGE